MINDRKVQYQVEYRDILVAKKPIKSWFFFHHSSRFLEYPQVRPTNPLYSSQSTIKTQGSNAHVGAVPSSKSSATLVNRRQKFDPQAPRRPSDWRWLAILCIILFFPLGKSTHDN